jgi:hypothetical protein
LYHRYAVTDELRKLKQTNNMERSKMNIIYRMLYNYLRKKVEREETEFRNARLLERSKLNCGYTKAGH